MSEIKSKKCKKSKKWAENEFFLPFSLQMFAVGRLAVYIGHRVRQQIAKVCTTPLNKQATCASALPMRAKLCGGPERIYNRTDHGKSRI